MPTAARAAAALLLLEAAAAAPALLTLLPNAPQALGAMCLDASPPGLYLRPSANGSSDWIIAIEGGGWCYNASSCYQRSLTPLGSSTLWPESTNLTGIEDDDCSANPAFCNFNVAFWPYCDGMSFSGDTAQPIVFANGSLTANLYSRGHRILHALMQFLVANTSIATASNIIVDGCSAGGLSVYLHVDEIASYVPAARVVGVADAGFFADVPMVTGQFYARTLTEAEVALHNASAGLSAACLADRLPINAWQCFTPQVAVPYVSHPIFALQSMFDTYQLQNVFAPTWVPGIDPTWGACVANSSQCTPAQQQALLTQWLPQFTTVMNYAGMFAPLPSAGHGVFLHSCFTHCQWGLMATLRVNGTVMYDAFVAWWSEARGPTGSYSWVDCTTWACNPSCGA